MDAITRIYQCPMVSAILADDVKAVGKLLENQVWRDKLADGIAVPSWWTREAFDVPRFALTNSEKMYDLVVRQLPYDPWGLKFGNVWWLQIVDPKVHKALPDYVKSTMPDILRTLPIPGADMYIKIQNAVANTERGIIPAAQNWDFDPNSLAALELDEPD